MFFSREKDFEDQISVLCQTQHSEQVIGQWCARSAAPHRQQVAHRWRVARFAAQRFDERHTFARAARGLRHVAVRTSRASRVAVVRLQTNAPEPVRHARLQPSHDARALESSR